LPKAIEIEKLQNKPNERGGKICLAEVAKEMSEQQKEWRRQKD